MPKIITKNPATEEIIAEYDPVSLEQALLALRRSREVFQGWKRTDVSERAGIIQKLGKLLIDRKKELAELITREMGKPITEAESEIERCASLADYYAKNGERFLEQEVVEAEEYAKSYVRFDPLGIVLSIMPWNFPFWQVIRFSIPTLLTGNVTLLKHAGVVTGTALKLEKLWEDAGVPDAVFKTMVTTPGVISELVKDVDGVSFTGSVEVGRKIAALAGANLKKCVLELGGSDPFIVLEDADIKSTCDAALTARLRNTGQSCIAAKRFIIHKNVAGEFIKNYLEMTGSFIMGDPMDRNTNIGPLVTNEQRMKLHDQVEKSVNEGAKVLLGGKIPDGKGYFYEPTVLSNVTNKMPVFREETFGPVSPILVVESEEEAIREGNNTEFGLGASLWTRDIKHGEELAKDMKAGNVSINKPVRSDIRLPFGGVKNSGIGREMSRYGLLEFVNIKSVIIGK